LTEADRPQDSTPLAADDMIGSLATRVRELALRVAQLEGELEAARRRIAVYEDFDEQVQDSLSAALRAANQIRERARVTAESIAEEARAQRPELAGELDAMRIERDALRRVITEAAPNSAPRSAAPVATIPMSEMRTAAAEALRGVFKELVAEIRASTPPAPAPAPAAVQTPQPAQAAAQTPAPAPARPDNPPAPAAVPPSYQAPPAQPPAAPMPAPASDITPSAPAQPQGPSAASASQPAQAQPFQAPYQAPYQAPPFARPTVVQPERSAVVEDVDVAPAASAPYAAPQPAAPVPAQAAPGPAAAEPAREQWATAATEAVGEVQVVLSPISSFPRLVELERRLQGMPLVRTVYARDFRNGVATLAIGLRHPMTVDEFAAAVTKLDYPRLRVLSTSGYVLELRIDSEASSIA
jgi:hypothetical protein